MYDIGGLPLDTGGKIPIKAGYGGQGLEFSIYGWYRIENDFSKHVNSHIVTYEYQDPDSKKFLPIVSMNFVFNKTVNQHEVALSLLSPIGHKTSVFKVKLESSSGKDWTFFHISHSHIVNGNNQNGPASSSSDGHGPPPAGHRMLDSSG